MEYNRTGATPEREEPLSIRDAVLTVITGFPPKLAALDMMKCAETGKIFISKDLFVSAIAEFTKDMDYLYKTSDMERSRIEGILLGLSLAKSAWDKDLGRSDIVENELYYQEELVRLNKDGKPS